MTRLLLFLALAFPLFAAPAKWEKDIAKFEKSDALATPPKGAYLFIGSSSVRMWDLKKSFPDLTTINRGFGGSELADSTHFTDRIAIPYQPKAIFLYAGDNDISNGKTAETVTADFQKFVAKIHTTLPKTDIIFLPIKPSRARWEKWPEMNKANLAIQKITTTNPKLHYLDTPGAMIKDGQKPPADLFLNDGLHMSKKGYALWINLVNEWIKKNP